LVWSLDGSPPAPEYDFQPLLGSQIRRYQITYSTPSPLELLMKKSASRLPYVRSPPVASPPKVPECAEKSHARPFGCSPLLCERQHLVNRVKPA